MTREEAIDILKRGRPFDDNPKADLDEFNLAIGVAIKAIKNEITLLDKLLQELEPIERVKVRDLPDTPHKNTIYTLEQEWIYLDNNWLRL